MNDETAGAVLRCPHDERCGACSLLGRPYSKQLALKRTRLMEVLGKTVSLPPPTFLETLPSPRFEGYRNRAKMAISTSRDRRSSLGYFARRTREVVDTPDCAVLVPELLETTRRLRRLLNGPQTFPYSLRHIDLRCGSDPTQQLLTLVVRAESPPRLPVEAIAEACPHIAGIGVNCNPSGGAQVLKGRIDPLLGVREVFVENGGLSMRVSAGSFFQVNLGLLPEIHRRMTKFLGKGDLLIDLYAGVGTHAFALRSQFRKILCVEGVRSSVADARSTIKDSRISNIEILASPVHRALRRIRSERPESIVLNPSRPGVESAVLETICTSKARRLAYLSCDPETLGRDLGLLTARKFRIVSIQPIDMMPQTAQIEALALLERP